MSDALFVQQRLSSAWSEILLQLRVMRGTVRPYSFHEVFKPNTSIKDAISYDVSPVVFFLPEKASNVAPNLYVVVKGGLAFKRTPDSAQGILLTSSFRTEIAYFRWTPSHLEHVYGAHYDLDETRPGHPVFHSQMSPKVELSSSISSQFRDAREPQNQIATVLANVRVPSAQMDFFSVITQVCADHLIYKGSPRAVRTAFLQLRDACNFFVGAAHRMAFLHSETAAKCYRSPHWYSQDNLK